jgi:hypothetical protein
VCSRRHHNWDRGNKWDGVESVLTTNKIMTKDQLEQLEREILKGLSVTPDDGVWIAVNKALDYQIGKEHLAAQMPGLHDHERQYQVGRDAGLENFKEYLRRMFEKARSSDIRSPKS